MAAPMVLQQLYAGTTVKAKKSEVGGTTQQRLNSRVRRQNYSLLDIRRKASMKMLQKYCISIRAVCYFFSIVLAASGGQQNKLSLHFLDSEEATSLNFLIGRWVQQVEIVDFRRHTS